jgi:phage FluMu gp28-like protein
MEFDGQAIIRFIEDNVRIRPDEEPVKLFPYQKRLLECQERFRLIVKARQIGVSSLMAWEALACAILYPSITILFVSSSERQASELLEYVKRAFFNAGLGVKLIEESKTAMRFANNSRIISLPQSPNTVMGFTAQRLYIDEFAFYEQDKKMIEAIIPSISHGGYVTIFSRPAGKSGEFYRLFRDAQQGLNPFIVFILPYYECPLEEYQKMVERVKSTMDEMSFKQTYMCEFVDEAVSFFPYELIIPCINDKIAQKATHLMNLKFGIDFGKKVNSTVVIIVEEKDGRYIVREIKEFLNVPYSEQLNYISERINELRPRAVNIDASGVGIRLHEELREKHGSIIVPYTLTPAMKEELIQNLRIMMEDKKLEIPRNETLISQLHSLERTEKSGLTSYRHEPGKHDDYVWALALAVHEYAPTPIAYAVGDEMPAKYSQVFRSGSSIKVTSFEEEEEI